MRTLLLFFAAVLVSVPLTAIAGPPFLTDDPEPVDYHHFEFYTFATTDKAPDGTTTQVPAFEFNFGAIPNVQLHIVVPYTFESVPGQGTVSGLGDTELGVKYRFVQETSGRPQIGIFPMAEIATGNASDGLGNGRTWYRLPLWIQKSYGPWTTYGGGGYALNAAPGMKNYPFGGWLVQRDFGEHLTLGGEIYSEGAQQSGGLWSTFYNVGGYVAPTQHFNILFSVGHTISGSPHAIAYFAFYWTGGP